MCFATFYLPVSMSCGLQLCRKALFVLADISKIGGHQFLLIIYVMSRFYIQDL